MSSNDSDDAAVLWKLWGEPRIVETNPTDDYLAAMKDLVTPEMAHEIIDQHFGDSGLDWNSKPEVVVDLGDYPPTTDRPKWCLRLRLSDQWIHKWREEHGLS